MVRRVTPRGRNVGVGDVVEISMVESHIRLMEDERSQRGDFDPGSWPSQNNPSLWPARKMRGGAEGVVFKGVLGRRETERCGAMRRMGSTKNTVESRNRRRGSQIMPSRW
jgi:hypothetical protein